MSEQTEVNIHCIKVYPIKLEEDVTKYKIHVPEGNLIDVVDIPVGIGIVIQHSKRWTSEIEVDVTVLRENRDGYIGPAVYLGYVTKGLARYYVYEHHGQWYPLIKEE